MVRRISIVTIGCVLAAAPAGLLRGQAFDCVHLNDNNTNIFTTPEECFLLPEHLNWCNCVRSLITNPVKGETTGFNQAIEWIVDQPGIGNHRIEVFSGTLDLSSATVGQVIGSSEINELVPQSVGVPPGTFFIVRSDVVVAAVGADSIDFEIVQKQLSPVVPIILRYNPLDACHYNGLQYRGTMTSRGPGQGFVIEYRFPKELLQPEDATCIRGYHPAIQANDAGGPGFTVRSIIKFISKESGLFTLPASSPLEVTTTLRRFTDATLDEILDLGAEDLCAIRDVDGSDQTPCKVMDESLVVKNFLGENLPPTAVIVMVDPNNAIEIPDGSDVQKACGNARVIFRGSNSTDGDDGLQTLSYEWSIIDGPAGGAEIPEATRSFVDTEITFLLPGSYEIRLQVNDGGAENNTDETSVSVTVRDDFDFNTQPTALIVTIPDPPEVAIAGGKATIELDGSVSANGTPGLDDCMQPLTYSWTARPGPGPVVFGDAAGDKTSAEFTVAGEYVIDLEVNDGAESDNLAFAEVTVTVVQGDALFRRGDSDGNGALEITDAIFTLNFLFSGGRSPTCPDAADADDNAQVEITDPIRGLNYLFSGGVPPAPPGPDECGADVEADELADCDYPDC